MVISKKTGIKARGDEKDKEVILVKTKSDYWFYIMSNHEHDYYTSDLFRGEANKIMGELDE